MQINVGASIAELLYEHQSVSLPGLGSFITSYKPATIDQVEGKIQPPSKQLNFNRNLLMDDGLLVQHLRKKYNVSYPTAMLAIEQFVSDAKMAIEKREIFTIPGVGRLYKDYEQNFKFLPDDVNFNTDAYGLPTLQFYPVLRSQRGTASKQAVAAADLQPQPVSIRTTKTGKRVGKWFQRNLAIVSSVAVIAIALVVYFQFFYQSPVESAVPSERYNVSPSLTTADEKIENPTGSIVGEDDPVADDTDETDTEGVTARPDQQYVMIGIGMFSQPGNVERLVKQIYEEGYEPFTEKVGNLTRVGIRRAYDDEQDVQKTLEDIRQKFGVKAQVLKKLKE